jgi:hypothetical protein
MGEEKKMRMKWVFLFGCIVFLCIFTGGHCNKSEPVPGKHYYFDVCGSWMVVVYPYGEYDVWSTKLVWGEVGRGIIRVETFPPFPTGGDHFPWNDDPAPYGGHPDNPLRSPNWVGWSSDCKESYFWGVRRTPTGRIIPVVHRFSVTEGTWLPPREVTEASAPILRGPQDSTVYPFYPVGSDKLLSLEMDGSEGVYRFWVFEEERWVKSGELRCSYPPPGTEVEDPGCQGYLTSHKDPWEGVWIPLAYLLHPDPGNTTGWRPSPYFPRNTGLLRKGRIAEMRVDIHRILFFRASEGDGVTAVVSFHPVYHWLDPYYSFSRGFNIVYGLFPPAGERAWFLAEKAETTVIEGSNRVTDEKVVIVGVPLLEPFPPLSEELKTYWDAGFCRPLENCRYWEDRLVVKELLDLEAETKSLGYYYDFQYYLHVWDRGRYAYAAIPIPKKEQYQDEFRIMVIDKVTGDVQVNSIYYPLVPRKGNWRSIPGAFSEFSFAVSETGDPEFLREEVMMWKGNGECTRSYLYWFVKEGENWKKYKIDEGGCVP